MNAANTEIVIRSNTAPVTVERRIGGRDFSDAQLQALAGILNVPVAILGSNPAQWIEVARYKASGKRMAEEHAKWLNERHPFEEYRARELTPAKPMIDVATDTASTAG